MVYLVGSSLFTLITSLSFAEASGIPRGSLCGSRESWLPAKNSIWSSKTFFIFFSLCLILETNFTLTRPAAILQLGLKRKKWLATPLKADVENSTRSFSLFFFFFQHSPRVANSLDSTREYVWNSGYRELKQRRLMHVNQIFYNNWANPRPLIGRELWFMRV